MDCLYSCLYCCSQFYERYIRNNKPVQIAIGVVGGALLMVILLAIFGAFRSSPPAKPAQYNVLLQGWPQTSCKLTGNVCKEELPKHFIIEGLWQREERVGFWTRCPNANKFEPSKLPVDLTNQLKVGWPSLAKEGNDVHLWEYQWKTHGTCTLMNPLGYFQKALKLFDAKNIASILEAKGIKPSNDKPFKKDLINDAIKGQISEGKYVLRCANVPDDSTGAMHSWLMEILTCVQANGETPIQCEDSLIKDHGCGDELYLIEDHTKPWGPQVVTTTAATTTKTEPPTTQTEPPTTHTTIKPEPTIISPTEPPTTEQTPTKAA